MGKKTLKNRKNTSNLVLQNRRLLKKIKALSLTDPLTGLCNYQSFTEDLSARLKEAKKDIFPISLTMIDIDYFKSINDTYGYRIGNHVLIEFANYLKSFAKKTDSIIRYGGTTFVIMSPDTYKGKALASAQALWEKTQLHTFDRERNKIMLKVSIGVICFPEDGMDTLSHIINALENTVREAKDRGGNVVCAYEAKDNIIKMKRSKEDELKHLRSRLKAAKKKLNQSLLESIYAFAKAIEVKDHYTSEHAEKTVKIVRNIGKELGLSKKDITVLEHAAVLHDLGKIGIDDRILRKKGKLTKKEYQQIKRHPIIGAEILRTIHFLKEVVPLILYHHERYDGKGYSSGLKGEEIPIGARILALADAYQALISDRPYRKAFTNKEALTIIKKGSGRQFDPDVAEALIKSLKKNKY